MVLVYVFSFHGGNPGSIPGEVTSKEPHIFVRLFALYY